MGGDGAERYEVSFVDAMAKVQRGEWDALAERYGNPLLSWGFLALLEASGAVRPETGWLPQHLLLRRGDRLVAAAPFYAKGHSWGEFVFDQGFAEFAESRRKSWYPKLVGMVPLTPCAAWRVLVAEGEAEDGLARAAVGAAVERARDLGLAGAHVLWPAPDASRAFRDGERGAGNWSAWAHQAYLWGNRGYGGFDDYLDAMAKNMRRNVRRERASVAEAGLSTRIVPAKEAARFPGLLEAMAELYDDTNARFGPWAAAFLDRNFWRLLPEYLPEGWALSAAYEAGAPLDEPVALAFLVEGRDRLYGRYWGTRRFVDGLHFELCYYRPIEYAIERGIPSFDPGMGGHHKARRGFESVLAPSFHAVFDPELAAAFRAGVEAAGADESRHARDLNGELPWKAPNGPPGTDPAR